MSSEPHDLYLDPPLTAEEESLVGGFTAAQVSSIDRNLLSRVSSGWQRMARIVAEAMLSNEATMPGIPDGYYARRLRSFVLDGRLQARGMLECMRYCELRKEDADDRGT
jgi:hypothetical protein